MAPLEVSLLLLRSVHQQWKSTPLPPECLKLHQHQIISSRCPRSHQSLSPNTMRSLSISKKNHMAPFLLTSLETSITLWSQDSQALRSTTAQEDLARSTFSGRMNTEARTCPKSAHHPRWLLPLRKTLLWWLEGKQWPLKPITGCRWMCRRWLMILLLTPQVSVRQVSEDLLHPLLLLLSPSKIKLSELQFRGELNTT